MIDINIQTENRIQEKCDKIMSNLKNISEKTVRESGEQLFDKIYENCSFMMLSPSESRALDYPHAARHGEIQPHGHIPTWGISVQSGDLREGLKMRIDVWERVVNGFIGWLDYAPDIVHYLIEGTSKMFPRPILRLTAEDINFEAIFLDNLKKNAQGFINAI